MRGSFIQNGSRLLTAQHASAYIRTSQRNFFETDLKLHTKRCGVAQASIRVVRGGGAGCGEVIHGRCGS